MPNLSDYSRKEQVLMYLKEHLGEWVDGVELANEEVGGSEGLKRLRELREEHYLIQKRQKPGADQFQYRLVEQAGLIQASIRPEVPNGGPDHDRPAAYHPSPRPAPNAPAKSEWGDWSLENAALDHYRAEYRVHNTRLPAEIRRGFAPGTWYWGLKVPAREVGSRDAPMGRREHRYGNWLEGPLQAAKDAVEDRVRTLREEGFEP